MMIKEIGRTGRINITKVGLHDCSIRQTQAEIETQKEFETGSVLPLLFIMSIACAQSYWTKEQIILFIDTSICHAEFVMWQRNDNPSDQVDQRVDHACLLKIQISWTTYFALRVAMIVVAIHIFLHYISPWNI